MKDWMVAESFWEMRETWSFIRKLQEAFRIDKAFMKSRHWLTSPQDLQYRKYVFYEAVVAVKAFRREMKRSKLTPDMINQRKVTVYGTYAQAMHEVEIWTGQSRKGCVRERFIKMEQITASHVLSVCQNPIFGRVTGMIRHGGLKHAA